MTIMLTRLRTSLHETEIADPSAQLYNDEMALSDSTQRAAPPTFPAFFDEANALRREIMINGVAGPAVFLGWITALASLILERNSLNWILLLVKIGLIAVALFAISFARGRTERLALWLCGAGFWGLAAVNLILTQSLTQAAWLMLACFVVLLLLGEWAGWLSVAAAVVVLVWLQTQLAGSTSFSVAEYGSLICMTLTLTLGMRLIQHVSGALLRTLNWMIEGYTAARMRAQTLSETSAELALALKSLQQTSQALAHANTQLEVMVHYADDARRSKQEFAANVSHELRTPLNLIIGFSDLMLRAPTTYATRLPPGLLSDIKVVHRNAHHLLNLVNDILDLSQMDVNHMSILREPMQVGEFVEQALIDFRQLINERGLTLSIEIAPQLPAAYADRTRIRQVLLNLVANALRFTQRGGITVRVTCPTDELIFEVIDTGIGIAPKDLQRIFEPFTQADGALDRRHGGTGLGLTISKEFVHLHGGRMWVESEPGHGSVFSFSLPLVAPLPESPALPVRWTERPRKGFTLAVIESGSTLSRILAHQLEGVTVLRAASPEALIEQQPDTQPDAILINRPGWLDKPPDSPDADAETYQTLETWQHTCPVAWRSIPLLHCYVPGPETYLNNTQVRRFLTKPVTQDEFNEALSAIMSKTPRTGAHINGRVLLIENDEDALRLLSRMLRAAPSASCGPYKSLLPIEAQSGEQALDILRSQRDGIADSSVQSIDAIVLDLGLGSTSGQDLLRALSDYPYLREIPVCIVSGQQLHTEPLVSSHLTLMKPKYGSRKGGGLAARELAESIRALLPVILVHTGSAASTRGRGF